jgi:hypothetical protein
VRNEHKKRSNKNGNQAFDNIDVRKITTIFLPAAVISPVRFLPIHLIIVVRIHLCSLSSFWYKDNNKSRPNTISITLD